MKPLINLLCLFVFIISTTSCRSVKSLADILPSAEFHKLSVKKIEPPKINVGQLSASAKLTLSLCFRLKNPYKKELPLPVPEFQFTMSGDVLHNITPTNNQSTIVIPSKSHVDLYYDYLIELDPAGQFHSYMGKDNPYEFKCTMIFNLRDYLRDSLSQRIGTQVIPIASYFIQRDVSRFKVEMAYDDTLRLPLPPVVSADLTRLPEIKFKGNMESLDLHTMRDVMKPFMNTLTNSTITVPDPQALDWMHSKNVNAADYVLGFLNGLGIDASGQYNNFKTGWNNFVVKPEFQYPGPNTTGIEIKLPVKIYNQNYFPIECPQFRATACSDVNDDNKYQPYYFEVAPETGGKIINSRSTTFMWITSGLNWNSGYTIPQILLGQLPIPQHPGLKGSLTFDLGYGTTQIPYKLEMPQFKMWK